MARLKLLTKNHQFLAIERRPNYKPIERSVEEIRKEDAKRARASNCYELDNEIIVEGLPQDTAPGVYE